MAFEDSALPVRLVFNDGHDIPIDATRLSENWLQCTHSSHPMEDRMIYWGDWLQVNELGRNCFKIIRVIPRIDMVHLFCEQGMLLYGGSAEDRLRTPHPGDPGEALMEWLHVRNAHLEWECLFGLCDGITLHLPREQQTELINGIETQHAYKLAHPFTGVTGQLGGWADCF